MPYPTSPSPELLAVLTAIKAKPANALPVQPLAADDAAALCLSMVNDPGCRVLPADAFMELKHRNAALLSAPRAEIQAALSRQSVLLEAVMYRFATKAAIEPKLSNAEALTKMSLSASRSLVHVLAALYSMARDDEADKAIEAKATHAH